jgi:hypothetical protein
MKKITGILLSLTIVASASATTHTNKTFLMPRDHNANLAMEMTTWHKQIRKIDEDQFKTLIQAVPFYQSSASDGDLGKYFGVTNRRSNGRLDDYIYVSNSASDRHLYTHDILMDCNTETDAVVAASNTFIQKIIFQPYQNSYGLRLDWHQKLDKLINGLYFEVNMPVVHVKHSMGYTNVYSTTQNLVSASTPITFNGTAISLEDYLTGNVVNDSTATTSHHQAALTHYKIHNGQSQTGIADLNLVLGYNFLYQEDNHIGINVIFTIPTGNTPDGEYRWEPVVGNGGHFAFGLGFDSAFEIWKSNNKSLDLSIAMNYKYLFESTEKRTVDFKYSNTTDFTNQNTRVFWGPYVLGGSRGDTTATPLANFLTQDLEITPGSQLDAMLMLSFNCGNWTFDLGYELYAKEEESLELKHTWSTGTYGIASWYWDTNDAFMDGSTATNETIYRGYSATTYSSGYDLTQVTIEQAHLLHGDAATPSQLTQKIFGSVGYAFNKWKYPLMLGLGGSYEFTSENSALELWALWFKLGIDF